MKRSVFLALAAGLIATAAFSAPAQAASTLVDTKAYFAITPGTATTTEVDFFYQNSGGGALSSITGISHVSDGGLSGVTFATNGTDEIMVTFTAANHTNGTIGPPPTPGLEFTFTTGNAANNVFIKQMSVVVTPGNSAGQSVLVTAGSVPEPASLALLGIGMTGFLAFRRFFKKTSVA
jgi:PEP-CTERM motif